MILSNQLIFYLLLFLLIILIFVIWIIWTDIIGAGFEPTSSKVVKRMLEMAQVDSRDVVYDLGSGDGRIVIEATRQFHAHSVGVEADPLRFGYSKLKIKILGLSNQVKIIWDNFFKVDISNATVVTLFLSAKANQKLKQKLISELKPGTRVVSYFWTIKGWNSVGEDQENHIYLYILGKTGMEYSIGSGDVIN
jgi:precorrin-6B methylase 2